MSSICLNTGGMSAGLKTQLINIFCILILRMYAFLKRYYFTYFGLYIPSKFSIIIVETLVVIQLKQTRPDIVKSFSSSVTFRPTV